MFWIDVFMAVFRFPGMFSKLRDAIREEWDNIPQATIDNLINSMRRRSNALRDHQWWTHMILTCELLHLTPVLFKGLSLRIALDYQCVRDTNVIIFEY